MSTNVLTPFSYAQVETPEVIPENEVETVEESLWKTEQDIPDDIVQILENEGYENSSQLLETDIQRSSISEEIDEAAYDAGVLYQVDSEGYRLINVISETAHTNSPKYSPKITPSIVAANKEVITEKFYKYFGWIECSGNGVAQFRKSEILVIVNNGKLYQISKYLLFVMAALLL